MIFPTKGFSLQTYVPVTTSGKTIRASKKDVVTYCSCFTSTFSEMTSSDSTMPEMETVGTLEGFGTLGSKRESPKTSRPWQEL